VGGEIMSCAADVEKNVKSAVAVFYEDSCFWIFHGGERSFTCFSLLCFAVNFYTGSETTKVNLS
jgi:hypothetical protein